MSDALEPSAPDARPIHKSQEAFRTISEVARLLDLPQHVLRFWETKFPQVSPLKRGGGRRYYRPKDIETLRRIRALLHDEGYTIKGVQKLLRKGGLAAADAASVEPASPPGDGGTPPEPAPPTPDAFSRSPRLDCDELQALLVELEGARAILKKAAR